MSVSPPLCQRYRLVGRRGCHCRRRRGRGGAPATTTTTAAGEGATVVSPFKGAAVRVDHRDYESTSKHDGTEGRRAAPGAAGAPPELTAENVDAVLNEVRPYLISDGGNV